MEHLWSETCKDGDQFDVEPKIKFFCSKVLEVGTDDAEGHIHHEISHNRLEFWNLQNFENKRVKRHTSAMMFVHHNLCLRGCKEQHVLNYHP